MWLLQILSMRTGKQRISVIQKLPDISKLRSLGEFAIVSRITIPPKPKNAKKQAIFDLLKQKKEEREMLAKILPFDVNFIKRRVINTVAA